MPGDGAKVEAAPPSKVPGTVRTGDSLPPDPRDADRDVLTVERKSGLAKIAHRSNVAELRMRFDRALSVGVSVLAASLFLAGIALALTKTGGLRDVNARRLLIVLGFAPIVAAAIAWLRRLPPMAGAIALDAEAGLKDRLATSLAFGAEIQSGTAQGYEATTRSMMFAAIDDAIALEGKTSPSRAVKIAMPRDLVAVVALAGVVAVVASLEIRKHIPAATTPQIDALEMSRDDIEALADFARQMEDHAHSPEMQAAVQEFNQLVEELKQKHIDRNEAFRRMAVLDSKLQQQGELDKKALDDAMKKLAEELRKNDMSREVGEAFAKGDKKEAEKKLKELSAKLKDPKTKLSEEQKKALADALKKASSRDREKSLAEMKAARDKISEEMERTRAEREKKGEKETAEQEKDRKDKERQLARLDREEKEQQSADRQLDKLDRDLDQAAQDLMKDLGLSATDIEAGAEDVNHMAEDEMSEAEKEELRERLKELHDLLVQQGKLTPEQLAKMKEFLKKAHGSGKQAKAGKHKKPGKMGKFVAPDGDPSKGSGKDGDEGDDGDDGDDPGGDGKPKDWTIGADGKPMPMPGGGGAPMPGAGGDGDKPGGHEAGVGHDPHMLGKKTSMPGAKVDTTVAGQAAGAGPSRSEVILGAADKGFVGKGYKHVYDEYKTVAEQTLKADEIPAGYRFYVRRYFDLIRPRDE